jgi:hypothetical protein
MATTMFNGMPGSARDFALQADGKIVILESVRLQA